jgi:hypothetical protein
MNSYDVEMCYGFNASLSVEANSREEAIEKAKQVVKNQVTIDEGLINCTDLEFEQITYINKR